MCVCIPAQVIAITDSANRLARVRVGGATREVSLACIVDDDHPVESCIGDWVLIHVGFAMSRIDEAEARKTLELLAALGEIEPQLAAEHAGRAAS
ncbi:MAG: HypC/HybG/HupF family hydrogenase formation chaperone [Caldimonas sp.]